MICDPKKNFFLWKIKSNSKWTEQKRAKCNAVLLAKQVNLGNAFRLGSFKSTAVALKWTESPCGLCAVFNHNKAQSNTECYFTACKTANDHTLLHFWRKKVYRIGLLRNCIYLWKFIPLRDQSNQSGTKRFSALRQGWKEGLCAHGNFLCVVNTFFSSLKIKTGLLVNIKYPVKTLTVTFKNITGKQLIDLRYWLSLMMGRCHPSFTWILILFVYLLFSKIECWACRYCSIAIKVLGVIFKHLIKMYFNNRSQVQTFLMVGGSLALQFFILKI